MPAARSSWKGYLKLSLVSVPVKAFTANNTGEELRLNQLHKDCHSRVRYMKVCPEHGELKSADIISGYEYSKDQYVVIDPSELMKLRPESDKAVRIDGFVDPQELDSIYLAGKSYYLLPDGIAGNKPYALLRKGMQDAGVVAVSQVVLSGREQLVVVKPVGEMLVMAVLQIAKKLKPIGDFEKELPEQDMTPEELQLAETLIDASRIEKFDYSSYTDIYHERLSELIQMKVDGQEVVQAPDPEEPKIINLMEALKASVAQAQSSTKRMAPSEAKRSKTTKKARKKKSG